MSRRKLFMPNLSPRRILIIENDEITASLIAYRLIKEGLTVETVRDGVSAIERLRANDFGAILLDLLMPRLDGFGVLQYINDCKPHLRSRIIVMTSIVEVPSPALEGTFRTIRKPLDYSSLASPVRECLARSTGENSGSWFGSTGRSFELLAR
jgi:DNA-binding NtrC family response regulator